MSFSVKNILIDVKLFSPLVSSRVLCSPGSHYFFSLAPSLPTALRCHCTLRCSLLYTGSWQCQPSSWLPQSVTLMVPCTVCLPKCSCKAPNLCIRLYISAWVSKSPHILYVQNQTHRVKTHTTSYNLFLVSGITVNPETCLLPYFLPIMWVWSVNPEASLPSFWHTS